MGLVQSWTKLWGLAYSTAKVLEISKGLSGKEHLAAGWQRPVKKDDPKKTKGHSYS